MVAACSTVDRPQSNTNAFMVEEVGRSVVVPSQPTHKHHMFLPAFDSFWQYVHYNQRLLFFELTTSFSAQQLIDKLKSSLSICLVHYYPWCGRLALGHAPANRLVIDCCDTGVDFVEARTDLPISELSNTGYQMMPFFEKLCQHIEHKGDCLYSNPLLSIQATLFSDGGLALGITQSHVVADGLSLWNFMISWGECSRGISPLSMAPSHERELLAMEDQPSSEIPDWKFTIDFGEADEVEEEPRETTQSDIDGGEVRIGAAMAGADDPLMQCLFNLSSSAIKGLKSDAGGGFTSFEVTCAHFWKHVTAARQQPQGDPTHLFVAVNCRSRLVPPLSSSYFGNVIWAAMSFSRVGTLCRESLQETAKRIHESIAKVQHEYVISSVRGLDRQGDKSMEEFAAAMKGKGINAVSSPRFPVYEVDFGWGKASAVRAAKVHGDGELVLFGGHPASNAGDMEICVALPASVVKRLLADPQFLATSPHSPF